MQLKERPRLNDPFYYLHNFQALLDGVQHRDGDLLADDEREFIERFAALPTPARALLVRMVMRKGELFRASRLVYAEFDLQSAVAPLVALEWVDPCPHLSLEELFGISTKQALARYFGLSRAQAGKPKAQLLADMAAAHPLPLAYGQWGGAMDTVYRFRADALCDRLRLMFFGDFRQDLTDFVLADLGIFKYESITLQSDSRPFHTRAHVECFLQLYRCRAALHAGAPLVDITAALPPAIAGCDWLHDRREKLRFQIGRAQERAGEVDAALALYADCTYPESRRREQRILERRARAAGALPRSHSARPLARAPEFRMVIDKTGDRRSVEQQVRDHLMAASADDSSVHYVENGLINSLFGLLCWPAIFAPVPGAFFHAFHQGPADLSSARFMDRRRTEFARCLAELRDGDYKDTVRRRWVEKAGISSPFVAWGLVDAGLLELALACFPAEHLARWCEWIACDVPANRSGFPDLVQFWPAAGRYRLIEVKGPGDRLQENQRRCLDFCLQHDMPVSVCYVSWRAVAQLA